MSGLDELRHVIRTRHYADEAQVVGNLLHATAGILTGVERDSCVTHAGRLVERCREKGHRPGTLDVFLQAYQKRAPEVADWLIGLARVRGLPETRSGGR